jgi:aerobic C4-dicarboxylate transport protein
MTVTTQPPQPLYRHLYVQVLAAIIIGVLVGQFFPATGASLKPLGDMFIAAIKMVIGPVIFCTVVHGIAGMQDMKKVGRVGLKALAYFEVTTTLALIIGLFVVNLWRPGVGMNVDAKSLDIRGVQSYVTQARSISAWDYISHIIPNTVVSAFAEGEMLQVLFFAILFAFSLQFMGDRAQPVLQFIEAVMETFFGVVRLIMKAAPIGAFGAMAFTIGRYGAGTLIQLGQLMASVYTTCLLFILVALGGIAFLCGFNILKFIRYIKDELLIVLGTSSSESVLPRMMGRMERLGCHPSVVGLVIPTGYSFNLDGTCIYLTMAAIFLAQATNTELTLWHQITILLILLLTSKGAAGVTGSGFIVLAATLSSVEQIPVAAIALILGVDRFMSEARALTNLIGNGVATVVIAHWEGELDVPRMNAELNGRDYVTKPDARSLAGTAALTTRRET